MFTNQKNNSVLLFIFLIAGVFLFANNASANDEKEELSLKSFLEDGDFAIQRKVVKAGTAGYKGLTVNQKTVSNTEDLVNEDLIDPFAREEVNTDVDFEDIQKTVDDEIFIDYEQDNSEAIDRFRKTVDEFFKELESTKDLNMVELLNYLVIGRIVSSPEKYVVIHDKKYLEGDSISVKFNKVIDREKFLMMIDGNNIITDNVTEQEEIARIKERAINRYDNLTSTATDSDLVVKVLIDKIHKKSVDFIIREKKYSLVAK